MMSVCIRGKVTEKFLIIFCVYPTGGAEDNLGDGWVQTSQFHQWPRHRRV